MLQCSLFVIACYQGKHASFIASWSYFQLKIRTNNIGLYPDELHTSQKEILTEISPILEQFMRNPVHKVDHTFLFQFRLDPPPQKKCPPRYRR